MNCEICALDTSVDSVMWTCAGCPRRFHAACIGVTTQRGSLRTRRAVDASSYVLPCCESCQELLQVKLDINKLIEQQQAMKVQLDENTQIVHRFASQNQPVQDALEDRERALELLLTSIKNELTIINKNSSLAGSVASIKNHMTSLLDTALKATKENIYGTLKTVTADISSDLRNINSEICQLNQQTVETAANCTLNASPMFGVDVLDELKAMFTNIMTNNSCVSFSPTPDSCPSLELELNNANNDNTGWRLLDTKRVWKADWTEYDARELLRLNQQKAAEKARKRRKQKKARYIALANAGLNSLSHDVRNNNNYNNSSNFNFIRNHRSSNPGNARFTGIHDTGNLLPPDRVLLAAAKNHFSNPPTNYQPTIQFQRGETLNPNPTTDALQDSVPGSSSAAACSACACRHTCFPRP